MLEYASFRTYDNNARWGIMRFMRSLIYRLSYLCGLVSFLRSFHKNGLTILLYHGVAPEEESSTTDVAAIPESAGQTGIYNYRKKFISPEVFEKQLEYLKKEYVILSLEDALQQLKYGRLAAHALVITFDDGYENNYQYAYPILKRMELTATVFVTTDFVLEHRPLWVDRLEYACGAGNAPRNVKEKRDNELRDALKKLPNEEKEERLRYLESKTRTLVNFNGDRKVYAPLTIDQMREMSENGMALGAHTQTHPILSHLSFEEARTEIVGSKLALEQQGFTVSHVFAYPNGQLGDWTDKTEQIVRDASFTAALTTVQGVNTRETNLFRLKRITMDGTDAGVATVASIVAGVRLYLSKIKHIFI